MPRTARLDTPGLLHHIMIRGIERRKIFNDDKDRENLIERLSNLLPETKTQCFARSFLSNHTHFLFRSGPRGIANLMRRLLTGYAVSYNRRHKRSGHLFQNRYKSVICEEDRYLKELVRYIHLNPLHSEAEEHFSRKYRLRNRGFDFEKVVERVSSLFDLEKEYITGRGRQRDRVHARDLLCYWCAVELGMLMADLAERLSMTLAAVSCAVKRGERIAKRTGFDLGGKSNF